MYFIYKKQRIFVFADTHGMHWRLPIPREADILICAGDVISDFSQDGLRIFLDWFSQYPAELRIFIPGNHEIFFDFYPEIARRLIPGNVILLEDGRFEYQGISFYSVSAKALQQKQWLHTACDIPSNIDMLITHFPPKGILDEEYGDTVLRNLVEGSRPKYHFFGHIHSEGGKETDGVWTKFCNVSYFQELEELYK